jgi:kumamolisin
MAPDERVELAGSAREPLEGARVAGEIDPDAIVRATVILRRARALRPVEAYAFGPRMHRVRLSREEFARRHGARARDLARVRAFAQQYRLEIAERPAGLRSAVLSGAARQMEAAFGTKLRSYTSPRGTYRGRVGPLTVPAPLGEMVTAVLGLDDRPVARPHIRIPAVPPTAAFTPPQVAELYAFPPQLDGTGQTIAIIELGGGFATADLASYFGGLGLAPPSVSAVSVDGAVNQPGVDPGTDAEVMLDIEVAGSIAPGAKIAVYFTTNTDQGFVDAISTAVHSTESPPDVLSISWGGPEESWTPQAANAMLNAVTDAAPLGVSVIVAAGDGGASDGVQGGQEQVDLPACLPPVLGCGGTELTAAGASIGSEVVWNDLASGGGATGGGVSRIFPLPSYQISAKVPLQPQTRFAGRGVPDVSGDADPSTGYRILVDGQQMVVGGTSAVAPLWAALIARLNQALGRPLGMFQPSLYAAGEAPFHDIVSGNNGYWSAGPGWDACTGLGSPNGVALLKVLQGLMP